MYSEQRIIALPLFVFNKAMEAGQYLDWAKISIQNPGVADNYFFKKSTEDVLVLDFWDIEAPLKNIFYKGPERSPDEEEYLYPMSEKQGSEIVKFVKKNQRKNFVIHCTAGVSRSGAVATFIHEFLTKYDRVYEQPYLDFKAQNPIIIPNNYILTTLRKIALL